VERRRLIEEPNEQLNGAHRAAVAAVRREDVVTDVHLAGLERVPPSVVGHPADDLAGHHDAGGRSRLIVSGPEPSSPLLVAPCDQPLRVAFGGRADRHNTIRHASQRHVGGSGIVRLHDA